MIPKIIILFLALGIIFRIISVLIIPPFTGNDELAHLKYAEHIQIEKRLPNLNLYPTEEVIGNEYFQPPLYYTLVATVLPLTNNQSSQLYLLRFISILFFIGTFFFTYKIVLQLKTNSLISISTLGIISLLPSYVFNSSTVNNDSLTILLASSTIYYLIFNINKPLTLKRLFILSSLSALALLCKLNGAVIFPAIIFAIYKKHQKVGVQFFRKTLIFLGIAFLPITLWLIYNLATYHYLFGPIQASTSTFTKVPFNLYKIFLVTRGTFATFWAAWGPANEIRLPQFVYILVFLISLFSLAGLVKSFPQFIKKRNILNPYTLLVITLLSNIILIFIFNISQLQPLGRYFFPSIIPISLFFVLGITNILPKKSQKLIPTFIISILLFMNLLGLAKILHYL